MIQSSAGLFIDTNNTVYATAFGLHSVLVWSAGSTSPTRAAFGDLNTTWSIAVTTRGAIYADNGNFNNRIGKCSSNESTSTSAMHVSGRCGGLFVDVYDNLYCSLTDHHRIDRRPIDTIDNTSTIVAGTGNPGSTPDTLWTPFGIFVDIDLSVYVADYSNHRIQLFRSDQLNATTVAGNGAPGTVTLSCPTGVALDGDGFLYIADNSLNRIFGSGPNGFRCIAGCTGTSGSAANQLANPYGLSFDSYGNLYVTDSGNSRIQKFLLATNSCSKSFPCALSAPMYVTLNSIHDILIEPSYNQPKIDPGATWNSSAITFAANQTVGTAFTGIFVNINNTAYAVEKSLNQVQVWLEGNATPARTISDGLNNPVGIFVTISGDVYVDNGLYNGRVDMWTPNSTTSVAAMYVNEICFGLFVDIYGSIYCSLGNLHQVLKKLFKDSANISTIVAGNGTIGSAPNTLHDPRGIFVDTNSNLYVADCHNNRIQMFAPSQSNGTTLLGNGASGTITIYCPNSVVLDADGHLFAADCDSFRIVGWGPNGYQCIAACSGSSGSSSDHLNGPFALYFDSFGNIFVSDGGNNRIQKFLIINNNPGEFTLLRG